MAWELRSYTRDVTGAQEANNADIAYSMHLAIRKEGEGDWIALNEDYGIYFPPSVPKAAVPRDARAAACKGGHLVEDAGLGTHAHTEVSAAVQWHAMMPARDNVLTSLKNPTVFRLAEGGYGIAAVRTGRGGVPDGSEKSSFLLAFSPDLLTYETYGQVSLPLEQTESVERVWIRYDEQMRRYQVNWQTQSGDCSCICVPDIRQPESGRTSGAVSEEARVRLTDEEARVLRTRFGRCHAVAVETPKLSVSADTLERDLRAYAVQIRYDDGSVAQRAVQWEDSAQKSVLHGTIRAPRYPVPFAVDRADPSIYAWRWNGEQLYFFIATEDHEGNCIDPLGGRAHMPMRVASSVLELSDAYGGREREFDLLRKGDLNSEGRAMTGCFWAPEIHEIGGKLSVLFMPCFDGQFSGSGGSCCAKPDMWTGRCHIMQLKQDEQGRDLDPRKPENWSVPEPILRADGGELNPVQGISLDMTVVQDSGSAYYMWQQVGSVWAARFYPSEPTRLTSEPRQIIFPEFAWDNVIAEGPHALVHNGTIFLIYSGSEVGIDYTTGLAMAPADKGWDLTDPASWSKLDYPLQKSGIYNGAWQLGTGHGMWSSDEDGNLLYVFHNAMYQDGQYCGREAQVRRVHWASDGMPVLDMQADEELPEGWECVSVEVALR